MTIQIGEIFNGSNVTISQHALEEAVKKFGKSHKLAEGWIRTQLKHAQYVGEVLDENNKPGRLFGYRRVAIIMDPVVDRVVTVYPRHIAPKTIIEPIQALIEREIRKTRRSVRAMEKYVKLSEADIKVEIAQLERRLVRTKSEAVRIACEARIAALSEGLAQLNDDLLAKRHELSTLLKGVVAFI